MRAERFSDVLFNPGGFRSRPEQRRALRLAIGEHAGLDAHLRVAGFADLLRVRDIVRNSWTIELIDDGSGDTALVNAVLALGTPTLQKLGAVETCWSSEVAREIASVGQRRDALLDSGSSFQAFAPAVSVLLCTRRPELLHHAINQVEAQVGVGLELIIGFHGFDWAGSDVKAALSEVDFPWQTVELPAELSLGACLNRLAERASGSLLARVDDDDFYGPHQILDLTAALVYSRAGVVGSVAEYVWFEGVDETVRRWIGDSETPVLAYDTARVTGGALAVSAALFAEVGGFPDLRTFEDGGFADRVHAAGSFVYRMHSLGYLARRTTETSHTYNISNDHYRRAVCETVEGRSMPLPTLTDTVDGDGR